MPVIIGSAEAHALMIQLRGIIPARPLTHALFASVLKAMEVKLQRSIIYHVEKGIFYSYLYLKTGDMLMRVDSRTSDAIGLCMQMNAPIYIYEDILEAECLKDHHFINEPMKEPQKQSIRQLQEALQEAVDREDYEKAAELRDIINQNKQQ